MTNTNNTPATPVNLLTLKSLAEKAGHFCNLRKPENEFGQFQLYIAHKGNGLIGRVYVCYADEPADIAAGKGAMVCYSHTQNLATGKGRRNWSSAYDWTERIGFSNTDNILL